MLGGGKQDGNHRLPAHVDTEAPGPDSLLHVDGFQLSPVRDKPCVAVEVLEDSPLVVGEISNNGGVSLSE